MATILIIDDSPIHRAILSRNIEKMGHVALEATDGEEGLEMIRDGYPDLVLLDITMPGFDGFDVLERLLPVEAARNIPVIIISASTDRELVEKARGYRVVSYLGKKMNTAIFTGRVGAALELGKKLRSAQARPVVVKEQTGKTMIGIMRPLADPEVMEELAVLAEKKLADGCVYGDCIIDIRYLPSLEKGDPGRLEDIFHLLPGQRINVIAGRHYGPLMLAADFESRVAVFISYTDLERFIYEGPYGED